MTVLFKPNANMFDDWGLHACPIIPTNRGSYANAGIAAEIRKHTPPDEFAMMHKRNPKGGLLQFSNGQIAWDLPTKYDILPGSTADIGLIQLGLKQLSDGIPRLTSNGINALLLPKVGSGLGNLRWHRVWECIRPIVIQIGHQIMVIVYAERPSSE